METTTKKGTKFVIDLGGLELPENVQAEISKELNKVVMSKLATLDLARDKAVNNSAVALIDLINGGKFWFLNGIQLDTMKQFTKSVTDKSVLGMQISMS
ncbi:MAG: hypothetical protein RLZZ628_3452 [Bacteroidota bacterium]|jgi:hypothetical protein